MATALKFYLNDDGLHEWTNLQYIHGDVPAVLQANVNRLIPFCHSFAELGAALDGVYVEYRDGTEYELENTALVNLITSWVNTSFDTFTLVTTQITSAINVGGGDEFARTPYEFYVREGELITVNVNVTLNAGQAPYIRLVNDTPAVTSNIVQLANGANDVILKATATGMMALQIYTTAVSNFSTDAIEVLRENIFHILSSDDDYDYIIYNGEYINPDGALSLDAGLARLRIELDDLSAFYSDYFEICDLDETCEDNDQLLDNNDFDNWGGDDPDDWDVTGEDVNNYITEDAAGVAEIITIDGDILTISQDDMMEIGEIYHCEVVLSDYTSGDLFVGGVMYSPEMDSADTFSFYVLATSTTFSLYTNTTGATSLKLTGCDLTPINRCMIDDYFNIWFHAYGDLPDPARIIYQTGFENRLAFDTLPIKPDSEINIEGEMDEALNETVNLIANKKSYQVDFLGGESLFDMMSILRFHEYIYVAWPDRTIVRAYNIEFSYDWVDDYLCHIVLRFSFDNLKKGGCDNNFTLD